MSTITSPAKNTATSTPAMATETMLAGRGQRFLGALIDGLMMMAISIPATMMFSIVGIPLLVSSLMGVAAGAVAFAAVNYKMLQSSGQTFGKRAMGIRIVADDNSILPAKTVLAKRYVPVWGVTAIPVVGGFIALVNALLIFGNAKQCGHDIIAGTKVVNVESMTN